MKFRLGKLMFTTLLTFSMIELTGCATFTDHPKQSASVQKVRAKKMVKARNTPKKLRDYSLTTKGDETRLLRKGRRARYSNALDSY